MANKTVHVSLHDISYSINSTHLLRYKTTNTFNPYYDVLNANTKVTTDMCLGHVNPLKQSYQYKPVQQVF